MQMLKMMGLSESLPNSLLSGDIPIALENLNREIAKLPDHPADLADDPEHGSPVSLKLRSHPLIQLLVAAAQKKSSVTWDSNELGK